jgi:hypothetical protein
VTVRGGDRSALHVAHRGAPQHGGARKQRRGRPSRPAFREARRMSAEVSIRTVVMGPVRRVWHLSRSSHPRLPLNCR